MLPPYSLCTQGDNSLQLHDEINIINKLIIPLGKGFQETLEEEMVEEAIFHIETGENINSSNTEGHTALHLASTKRHLETVTFLIESKADIESKSKFGCTALHYASERGHLETVKFLIESKADIESKDNYHRTALHLASQKGHLETVKFLIESKANINAEDENGNTALDLSSCNQDVVGFLSENGAKSGKLFPREPYQDCNIS